MKYLTPDGRFTLTCREECDPLILREIFIEDVYRIGPGYRRFADTGICLDVGANIGAFSVQAVACGAKRVIAVEPEVENFALLLENTRGLSVEATRVAVWSESGVVHIGATHGAAALAEIRPCADAPPVPAITLVELYARTGASCCDVLKVDVEGSEYAIFAAAPADVIAKARYITLEFHPAEPDVFGRLIATLSVAHQVTILGSHAIGGYIYAQLYGS